MLTRSGLLVLPGPTGPVPSIPDIALGLSRMPRFGGQTEEPWTVAHHSLVVELLMWDRIANVAGTGLELTPRERTEARLAALLHDGHECVTGDIPSTWKHYGMKELQAEFDHRLWRQLHIAAPGSAERDVVHVLDHRALLAEGMVFMGERFLVAMNATPRLRATAVRDVIHIKRVQHRCRSSEAARARFVELAESLLAETPRVILETSTKESQ